MLVRPRVVSGCGLTGVERALLPRNYVSGCAGGVDKENNMPNPPDLANKAHAWYEENAAKFADAAVIELPFIGMDAEGQERLNRFKLSALGDTGLVDFTGKRVLDFGAGHARLALAFPTMASYLGVDFSANLVAIGEARLKAQHLEGRAQLVHADCTTWRGPKEHFDIVCSLGMFAYLVDPEAMLKSMAFHLRPGGVLFIDYRSSSPLWDPIRTLKWRLHSPTGGKTWAWKRRRTETMLRNAGLADIRIVMREYPLLGGLYAGRKWDWPLALRNAISEQRLLEMFATEGWAFARKPLSR
jgi:ubiquinone/menaquinone biosynthesis C-methylase UbiE